jgi:S-DNA-T family DNA segregation ATPase FtsK/SpoIIIE
LLGARFKMFDDISAIYHLQAISDNLGVRRIALIVDGLDSEKILHPAPAFKSPKPGDPPSPADLLKTSRRRRPEERGHLYLPLSTVGSAVPPHAKTFSPFSNYAWRIA